jgi:dipeptidyl aminopeptidase/acylaminoacyl peptidase
VALYATAADEQSPRISPDGRALAYVSNQAGRSEVYLARLPGVTGHVRVSGTAALNLIDGGLAWGPDGKKLFFLDAAGKLFWVPIATSPELRVGKPTPVAGAPKDIFDMDVAPNGKLLLLYEDRSREAALTLVENWVSRVRRR